MATALQAAHNQLVREVAANYRNQGYDVHIEPDSYDLPEFLRHLRSPDLIVTKPDGEHVFVEVKLQGRERNADYWKELQNTIEAHPGWRFEFVSDNRREQELIDANQPLFSTPEIEQLLVAGRQLVDQGLRNGGLLIIWSALEALLRRISQEEKIEIPDGGAATLLTKLTSEGLLDREDFRILRSILSARNQAAHGHQPQNIDDTLVEQAQEITHRLLAQQKRAA